MITLTLKVLGFVVFGILVCSAVPLPQFETEDIDEGSNDIDFPCSQHEPSNTEVPKAATVSMLQDSQIADPKHPEENSQLEDSFITESEFI